MHTEDLKFSHLQYPLAFIGDPVPEILYKTPTLSLFSLILVMLSSSLDYT